MRLPGGLGDLFGGKKYRQIGPLGLGNNLIFFHFSTVRNFERSKAAVCLFDSRSQRRAMGASVISGRWGVAIIAPAPLRFSTITGDRWLLAACKRAHCKQC